MKSLWVKFLGSGLVVIGGVLLLFSTVPDKGVWVGFSGGCIFFIGIMSELYGRINGKKKKK